MIPICCRTRVEPLIPDVAIAQLQIGQFLLQPNGTWRREIPEEETSVTATLNNECMILSLSPAVSSTEGHHHKRIAASVMYSIAGMYAEKVNGVVTQVAINVPACMGDGPHRVLASYPSSRLDYAMLCPGFRSVFVGDEA